MAADITAKLAEALDELLAMVRGECPSLLNEDSGGSAHLETKIEDALLAYRQHTEAQAGGTEGGRVEEAHRWATQIAVYMAEKFYPEVSQWKPLPDLLGVLTQIDNMTTGLTRAAAPAAAQDDLPEPFFRTSKTGGAFSIEQMRAHFEAGRQQGMSQANALWEMAKAEQAVPVAWMFQPPDKRCVPQFDIAPHGGAWVPLYTSPPATERRPLTELRINQIAAANEVFQYHPGAILEFARDIELAHNIGTAGTTEQAKEQGQ